MTCKRNTRKSDLKAQMPVVEVLPAEKAAQATPYATALAKADAVLCSAGGACQGVIPTLRAAHGSAWQGLMSEDQAIRQQVLQLKARENEVLAKIRDRVASNLMETMDTAIEEGVLDAPEEV
jgi:hypothetical protein